MSNALLSQLEEVVSASTWSDATPSPEALAAIELLAAAGR
jgi:hypothetical protein